MFLVTYLLIFYQIVADFSSADMRKRKTNEGMVGKAREQQYENNALKEDCEKLRFSETFLELTKFLVIKICCLICIRMENVGWVPCESNRERYQATPCT